MHVNNVDPKVVRKTPVGFMNQKPYCFKNAFSQALPDKPLNVTFKL